ncbi:hypothetical protein LB566_26530 [Mesorhizobium sp. CA13]|uniref:hypothetical protein n=1 Tax=unclassified Mesorhizobium TaxID=325217 RepID=UPI001CC9D35F|nr:MULTISPECIES: hypothetical protein [unclassified Mesorhizobium]MBZ9857352.1 hypothetical protein [Mesorhizobium sp. CA13]MBZ9967810.1 hypothetical protein [Mesorhizobium sp. BR1-1-2]
MAVSTRPDAVITAAGNPMASSADARPGLFHSQSRRNQASACEVRTKLIEPVDRRLIVGAIRGPPLKDECDQFSARHGNCRTKMGADTLRSQAHPLGIALDLLGGHESFYMDEAYWLHLVHPHDARG